MNLKHQKCFFFGPQNIKNKKIEQFRATNKRKMFNLHFWSTKLTQINHIIVKLFSDILLVRVYIYKCQIKVISLQRHYKKNILIYNKNLPETIMLSCAKIRGFIYILLPFCVLLI